MHLTSAKSESKLLSFFFQFIASKAVKENMLITHCPEVFISIQVKP